MLTRPLPRAEYVWVVVIGGGGLLDYWADRGDLDGDTVSECTRRLFRTHTPVGRAVFTASLAVGATWLHRHILKPT